MNTIGTSGSICAETVPSAVAALRAAGRVTVKDEAYLVRLHHDVLARAKSGRARDIAVKAAAEQVEHYEAALRTH